MTDTVRAIPEGFHTVTPYLLVEDALGLIEFLKTAFDARVVEQHLDDEGGLVHASLQIGDSRIMMGEARPPEWPAMPTMLHLYVEDTDTLYRRALEAGARTVREPEDQFYGDRSGGVLDPAGNQWWISTHVEDVSEEEMERRMARQKEEAGSAQ